MAKRKPYSLRRIVVQLDEAEHLATSDDPSDHALAWWLWCSAFDEVPASRLAKVKRRVASILKRPAEDFWQRQCEG